MGSKTQLNGGTHSKSYTIELEKGPRKTTLSLDTELTFLNAVRPLTTAVLSREQKFSKDEGGNDDLLCVCTNQNRLFFSPPRGIGLHYGGRKYKDRLMINSLQQYNNKPKGPYISAQAEGDDIPWYSTLWLTYAGTILLLVRGNMSSIPIIRKQMAST